MANRKTIENQYYPQTVSHPGRTLEEKLQEMEMSIREFAIMAARPEETIISIIKGQSSVTSEYAVIFESVTHIPARFWLALQRNYDESLLSHKPVQHTKDINPLSTIHKRISAPFGRFQYGG